MEEKQQFKQEYGAYIKDILWMCIPLFFVSFFYFGPRVLFLALIAVVTARLCDWIVAFVRSRIYDAQDLSSVAFALLLVMLMPPNVPVYMLISAVLMTVLVAKEAFGGTGHYPFQPVAVGICMAVVCWPQAITQYPQFQPWMFAQVDSFSALWDLWTFSEATMINSPSYYLKTTALPPVELLSLFLGNYAGSVAASSVAVILACSAFLLLRRRIRFPVLLCFLATMILLNLLFPRVEMNPAIGESALSIRLQLLGYELFSGSTIFVAVFLANDPTVLPKSTLQQAVYGVLLGVFTIIFRYFGVFSIGACFAVLVVNALSGFTHSIEIRPKQKAKSVEVKKP